MRSHNRQFLEDNRWAQESYQQESPPRLLGFIQKERMQQVIREEFDPGFSADLWCESCIRSMVLNCYNYYDQYLKNESKQ